MTETQMDPRVNTFGRTMGDPDGPDVFVASLGQEVPTFVDERKDLLPKNNKSGTFKRLNYHIPFKMRGTYKPEWLPHDYAEHMGMAGEIRTNFAGLVLCSATSKGSGEACAALAVNRANVCRNHGGALHPADKKMSIETLAEVPKDRIENLNRVQKFLQGFLPVEELTEEEVVGGFVFTDDGRKVTNSKLGVKFQQQVVRELHRRMNQFMQMKLPTMLQRVADIAESDVAEPETSLKAAIWLSERQMGKTPEVVISHVTGAPYETLLDRVESGSREDYRKSVESSRGQGQPLSITGGSGTPGVYTDDGQPLDVFEVDDGEEDPDVDEDFLLGKLVGGENVGSEGNSVRAPGVFHDGGSTDGGDSEGSSHSRALELEAKAKRAKEIIAARKKAQKRRYAARAQGASTVTNMAWLPYFKKNMVMRSGKMVQEGWRCLLVCPDDQNERMLAKIAADDNETS